MLDAPLTAEEKAFLDKMASDPEEQLARACVAYASAEAYRQGGLTFTDNTS
jgi:hypothetical protein